MLGGGKVPGIFTDDAEFEGVDDYVEEYTDKEGNHMRKEVHKGDGWGTVQITSDAGGSMIQMGGGADPFGDGDFMGVGDLLGAMMAT